MANGSLQPLWTRPNGYICSENALSLGTMLMQGFAAPSDLMEALP